MKKVSSMEQLRRYVKARHPAVWLKTWEERRVLDAISTLCADAPPGGQQPTVRVVWSCTKGAVGPEVAGKPVEELSAPEAKDPMSFAEWARDLDRSAMIVVLDMQRFFQSGDPALIRIFRDMIDEFPRRKSARKHLIFIGPSSEIPEEIEKDVAVIDWDLPTAEELGVPLDALVRARENQGRKPPGYANDPDLRRLVVDAGLGLTHGEFCNALAVTAAGHPEGDVTVEGILYEKKQVVRRTGIMEIYEPDATIADVGGLDLLKGWIRQRQRAFGPEAEAYGLPSPRGILMVGIPGTGKSLCAKVIGALWQRPILRFDLGKIFSSLVGESEANMRSALQLAETIAPCVVFIDEVDKGLSGTSNSGETDSGVTARIFGELLVWLNDHTAPVFVVMTANDISGLPPELLRKGRIDELFFVDLPNAAAREEIFHIHIDRRAEKAGVEIDDIAFAVLAGASMGFSGSEIEQAVISAMYAAFDAGERPFTTGDILVALQETVPLSKTMKDRIDWLRDWAKNRARPASSSDPIRAGDAADSRFD